MSMASTEKIEEQAAEWLVRRDGADWCANDEARLHAWLDESGAHAVAFIRLEAAWEQARRLKALGPGLPAGVVPPPGQWQVSPFFDQASQTQGSPERTPEKFSSDEIRNSGPRRRTARRFGIAASILIALGAGGYFLAERLQGELYVTPLGGVAAVPIADGSRITLNTASEVRVALSPSERRVELKRGEAFFEVAKDPSRPFVVEAGSKRVVAVGTKFSVRRDGGEVEVVVTEGVVRLESAGSTRSNETELASTRVESLTPGKIARANAEGLLVERRELVDLQEKLAWRAGYVVFNETALADAVAEFNRYNAEKLVIDDPAVAAYRVSGKFRSTSFESFVRLLETAFPIEARHTDSEIRLSARH